MRAGLTEGETVGVLGSAGGVGVATIQVAKAMGARVVALAHRKGTDRMLRGLGADEVVSLEDGWGERMRDLTGAGVDIMVDPVGGDVFDEALRHVAPNGRYVVVGLASGGIPTVKLNRVLFRNVAVMGAAWGASVATNPLLPDVAHAELTAMVAGGLRPPVSAIYELGQMPQALRDLRDGAIRGKAVVRVAN